MTILKKIKLGTKTKKGEKAKEKKWLKPDGKLTVDVYETDSEIIIQSAVAGVKAEDLDIFVEDDVLEIRGLRESPEEAEGVNYFYQECYWGPFSREIILPKEVDNSKIKASMKTGILVITLPKIEKEKKTKIKLETKKKKE